VSGGGPLPHFRGTAVRLAAQPGLHYSPRGTNLLGFSPQLRVAVGTGTSRPNTLAALRDGLAALREGLAASNVTQVTRGHV